MGRERQRPHDGSYYADAGMVWKAPVAVHQAAGGTSITVGFPVCSMHAAVSDAGADAVAKLMNVGTASVGEGQFLLDRLDELEIPESLARDWYGHVEPAIERFRAALAKADTTTEGE